MVTNIRPRIDIAILSQAHHPHAMHVLPVAPAAVDGGRGIGRVTLGVGFTVLLCA
jgi:hypothetical protein